MPCPTTAAFRTSYRLVAKASGREPVTANPGGTSFVQGTVVTLTATPDTGTSFSGWTGGCSGTAPTCTVTINADTTVTANFGAVVLPPAPASYRLVLKTNGSGSASSDPSGSSFSAGTSVNGVFSGWTGACAGQGLVCTITVVQTPKCSQPLASYPGVPSTHWCPLVAVE